MLKKSADLNIYFCYYVLRNELEHAPKLIYVVCLNII